MDECVEFFQNGPCQAKNIAAGLRRAHTSAIALKNWNAQVVLNLADSSAEARLL